MSFFVGLGIGIIILLIAAPFIYRVNKDKLAAAYGKFEDMKSSYDTLLKLINEAKADAKAAKAGAAAAKAFGGSAVSDLTIPIGMIWDWVKRGRKAVAIQRMNSLIRGQFVYIWYYTNIKPSPLAVSDAEKVIAYLNSELNKMIAYEG